MMSTESNKTHKRETIMTTFVHTYIVKMSVYFNKIHLNETKIYLEVVTNVTKSTAHTLQRTHYCLGLSIVIVIQSICLTRDSEEI